MMTRSLKKKHAAVCVISSVWKKTLCTIDPISLQRVRRCIHIVRNKCTHTYDVDTLFDYIVSSGDYKDPLSRIEYDACELMRLCHLKGASPNYLYQKREEFLQQRKQYFERSYLCDAFEDEINEQMESLHETTEFVFMDQILPIIIQSVQNLMSVDRRRCKLFLQRLWVKMRNDPLQHMDMHWKVSKLLLILMNYC